MKNRTFPLWLKILVPPLLDRNNAFENVQNKFSGLKFFISFLCCFFLIGCDENGGGKLEEDQWKSFYTISLGEDTFQVPTKYLLDADNRKDGAQRYVRIMAKIPDLTPFDNAFSYTNPPDRTSEGVSFNLNYGDGKNLRRHSDSLLHLWSQQGHYTVPDTWEKEGLVHLGIFMLAGKSRENIYAFIRDGKPIAQLRCATYSDIPNPGCRVYQVYRDYMSILVVFDVEHLDWYVEEGMDRILHIVESWRIKP